MTDNADSQMMSSTEDLPTRRDVTAIWLIAVIVAVPALVWMYSALRSIEVPPSQAFFEYNLERVQEFEQATADGAIGVVFLGDSRMRYGTERQAQLSERISAELGVEVKVLRLVNNWATLQDFEPLLPIIIDAEPSLVVVQEELRRRNNDFDQSDAFKREYLWRRIFGRTEVWNPGGRSQAGLQEEMRCEVLLNKSVDDFVALLERWNDFDEHGDAVGRHDRLVGDLASAGISLRYLDLPVSSDAMEALPYVPRTPHPVGIAPDIEIPDQDFCDLVHMAEPGRAAYTEWLVQAIAEEVSALP